MARKDHAQAIAIGEVVIEKSRQFGLGQYLPEALFLKGKAHVMNGEHESARSALEAARLAAEALGSRRLLWQILAALGGVELDHEKSTALKNQAREVIQFIADHIASDEFRSLFLQSEGVSAVIA